MSKSKRTPAQKKDRRAAIFLGLGVAYLALKTGEVAGQQMWEDNPQNVDPNNNANNPYGFNSPYYNLSDFTKSSTALNQNINSQWTPDINYVNKGQKFAKDFLDPLTSRYGKKLKINSWWRSAALDAALGVSHKGHHATGQAVDINPSGYGSNDTANIIKAIITVGVPFDQLIIERGTVTNPEHIHVSSLPSGNRGQILRYDGTNYYMKNLNWLSQNFGI